ncbi:MAG: hypothetical protein ACOYXB_00015 [Bacteroidota bacterium]
MNKKKKVIAINAALFAGLFGLISLNKEVVRPALQPGSVLSTLAGCFPNFIAAFLISMAFVSSVIIREFRYGRLLVYAASLAVFAVLTLEEIKPMWGASTQYDLFDIIASGVGSILAITTFELITALRKRRTVKD